MIIEKINSNLLKYRQSDTFYLMYENWLDERSARRFEKLSHIFYGQYPNQ